MTVRATWAEKTVLSMVGIRDSEIDARLILLARRALEEYYYLNAAADWLADRLDKTPVDYLLSKAAYGTTRK